jgi:hypothetical protein
VLAGTPGAGVTGQRKTIDWKPDDKPFDLEAELKVGFGGLEETYTSRVQGKPFESVTVSQLMVHWMDRADGIRLLLLNNLLCSNHSRRPVSPLFDVQHLTRC